MLLNNKEYSTPLVDVHVHIKDRRGLDAVAQAGICAVRDAGTREGVGLGIKKTTRSGMVPVVISAGRAISKKGGYGSLFGNSVAGRDDIKSAILGLKCDDADIIKVMASGMVSLKHPGTVTRGGFDRDELAFAVAEAAAQGFRVMAHANGEQAIIDAAEAGVVSIEHGYFMTSAALAVLAKRKVFWVPTVGALRRAAQAGTASAETRHFIDGQIHAHLAMLRHAYASGVLLAVGTDFVLPGLGYREAYSEELAYFERAGIPGNEVLRIAGEGGMKLLGI